LNSLTPKQQLVYHMLRIFVSTFKCKNNRSVIKRYHIKTLLLWSCEQYKSDKWNSLCVVSLCTQLMHDLAMQLTSGIRQPMYFVAECNLFDAVHKQRHNKDLLKFASILHNLNDKSLAVWFVENYVVRCQKVHPYIRSLRGVDPNSSLRNLEGVLVTYSIH